MDESLNGNKAAGATSALNAGLVAEPVYFTCPFCGGHDYDLIELKVHYQNGWCDEFNELETGHRGG
jgi:hypothetical protein